jgi:hypothetical protein
MPALSCELFTDASALPWSSREGAAFGMNEFWSYRHVIRQAGMTFDMAG